MAREYYSLGSAEEDKLFFEEIIKLLKIRMATEGWRNNSLELLAYLKSKYGLKLTTPKINKLLKGNIEDFNVFQKKYELGFWDLVKYERVQIKKDILKQADFLDYYDIDKVSTLQMMKEMIKGEYCFFFNTYLDQEDWHSPLIHLHQSIQKTTEYYINSKSKEFKLRNFRIMFLSWTEEQLTESLYPDSGNEVQENFFFQNYDLSVHVHKALGINLAVVCLDQLAKIIVKNFEFFNNIIVLSALGLMNIYDALNLNVDDKEKKLVKQLKLELEKLNEVPTIDINNPTAHYIGLDYLDIKKKNEEEDKKSIWVAYKDVQWGLSFSSMNSNLAEDFYKYKKRFSDIIINELTTEAICDEVEWNIPEEGVALSDAERTKLESKFYKLLDSISVNSSPIKQLVFRDEFVASRKLKKFL